MAHITGKMSRYQHAVAVRGGIPLHPAGGRALRDNDARRSTPQRQVICCKKSSFATLLQQPLLRSAFPRALSPNKVRHKRKSVSFEQQPSRLASRPCRSHPLTRSGSIVPGEGSDFSLRSSKDSCQDAQIRPRGGRPPRELGRQRLYPKGRILRSYRRRIAQERKRSGMGPARTA